MKILIFEEIGTPKIPELIPHGEKYKNVDEFVKMRFLPEFQPIVMMLRELLHEMAPDSEEEMKYGIPGYGLVNNRGHQPYKEDITFAFSRGADVEDNYDLLKIKGTISKHPKFKTSTL